MTEVEYENLQEMCIPTANDNTNKPCIRYVLKIRKTRKSWLKNFEDELKEKFMSGFRFFVNLFGKSANTAIKTIINEERLDTSIVQKF